MLYSKTSTRIVIIIPLLLFRRKQQIHYTIDTQLSYFYGNVSVQSGSVAGYIEQLIGHVALTSFIGRDTEIPRRASQIRME